MASGYEAFLHLDLCAKVTHHGNGHEEIRIRHARSRHHQSQTAAKVGGNQQERGGKLTGNRSVDFNLATPQGEPSYLDRKMSGAVQRSHMGTQASEGIVEVSHRTLTKRRLTVDDGVALSQCAECREKP